MFVPVAKMNILIVRVHQRVIYKEDSQTSNDGVEHRFCNVLGYEDDVVVAEDKKMSFERFDIVCKSRDRNTNVVIAPIGEVQQR